MIYNESIPEGEDLLSICTMFYSSRCLSHREGGGHRRSRWRSSPRAERSSGSAASLSRSAAAILSPAEPDSRVGSTSEVFARKVRRLQVGRV